MSDISVNVTNAGAASVAVSSGSTVNATVGNNGAVSVSLGAIAPGNATVVSGTLTIGKVTTLAAGSPATATNVGTSYAAIIDLGIPAGATGPAGKDGSNGVDGKDGITPSFSIGTVTTGAAGSSATVKATTTDGGAKVSLDFEIPRGDTGATGSSGSSVTLSDATPQPAGTASAGTSSQASRADHTHAVPVISYTALTNVPSTFAPSTHTHTASDVTDFTAAVVAAAPVTTVATRTGDITLTTADIGGLDDALAGVNVELIDGGDYVGAIVSGGGSITITAQPANQSAEVGAAVSQTGTMPSGTWNRTLTYANSLYYAVAADVTGGDYYATSPDALSWTKRYGLARPGSWQPLVYGGGKYVISNGTYAQISTDGLAWSESALSGPLRFANDKWFRFVDDSSTTGSSAKLYVSDDLTTWSSGSALLKTFAAGTSLTAGGTLSTETRYRPTNVASVVYFGARWIAFSSRTSATATAASGGVNYWRGGAWIWTSSDAATWAAVDNVAGDSAFWSNGWARASSSSGSFVFGRSQVVNGELWVSGGTSDGSPQFAVTSDGSTWALRSIPRSGSYSFSPPTVAYGNSTYVAAWGSTIWSSTNGTSWTQRTPPSTVGGAYDTSVEANFIDGYFWVLNYNGTTALRSSNGADWTAVSGLTPFDSYNRIAVGSSLVAANPGVVSSSVKLTFSASSASATFSVSAFYAANTLNYQWQVSTDAGSTWTDVSGATAPTLVLSGLTTADSGKRFRCVLSATGATTVTSNSATLTVT